MNEKEKKQNTSNIADSVMERIESENVVPTSHTMCVIKRGTFWVLWGITIVLGAVSVSILIFTNLNIGWEYYEATHDNAVTFFVETLPVLWLVLFGIMSVVAYKILRHTKRGYKYPFLMLVLVSVGASFFGGVVLHGYGMAHAIEAKYGAHIPFHRPVAEFNKKAWIQPERGLYSGVVEMIDDGIGRVQLLGYDNNQYIFTTQYLHKRDSEYMRMTREVRIIAAPGTEGGFLIACRVLPTYPEKGRSLREMRDMRREFVGGFERPGEISATTTRTNPCMRLHFGGPRSLIQSAR